MTTNQPTNPDRGHSSHSREQLLTPNSSAPKGAPSHGVVSSPSSHLKSNYDIISSVIVKYQSCLKLLIQFINPPQSFSSSS